MNHEIKTLIIPIFIKTISNYSFNECSLLTQITISSSVTSNGRSVISLEKLVFF